MSSASSDRSMHPLDIMPAWAWAFAAAILLGTASLFGLAALDILKHNCTTHHALCAKSAAE
jgi:hypothetical protein